METTTTARARPGLFERQPEGGQRHPGSRKIRWGREGKGKSAGIRVIYYHYPDYQTIHLIVPYTKNMKSDLTPDDRREICVLAEEFQLWLSERQKRVE